MHGCEGHLASIGTDVKTQLRVKKLECIKLHNAKCRTIESVAFAYEKLVIAFQFIMSDSFFGTATYYCSVANAVTVEMSTCLKIIVHQVW